MAAYFPTPDDQRDASTVLHLRDPLPSSYSEGPVLTGNMIMYMNYPSSSGPYSGTLPGNTQQQANGIAVLPGASDSNPSEQVTLTGFGGSRMEEHASSEWKETRNSMILMHAMAGAGNVYRHAQNLQGQGLSLTLSTHVPSGFQMPSFQSQTPELTFPSLLTSSPFISGEGNGRNEPLGNNDSSPNTQSRNLEFLPHGFLGSSSDPMKSGTSPFVMSGSARAVPNPKYLKAAQQLLDEVVNVKKALKEQNSNTRPSKDSKEVDEGSKTGASDPNGTGSSANPQESGSNSPSELSAAEKHDLQNKMRKLLAMLDKVDRRNKQYYHQMQIVVSSFDVIAGSGAAKPYTALALQTISRHFRCLRDAIGEQLQAARKSLGEQDVSANSKGVGISRLRYVDQQIKQQRALQQLGMMQQHAWRPQRGLPERSVSILRAWLFEHFLHPYPKDSDKIMLARQTGLTRSQVSNWFINARVRLWKPMVEEMYKEDFGDGEIDIHSPSEVAAKASNSDAKASEDRGEDQQQSTASTTNEQCSRGQLFESQPDHYMEVKLLEPNINHALNHTKNEYRLGKSRGNQRSPLNDCSILPDAAMLQSNEGNDQLIAAAYHMAELERFGNGSGVSLTLGLQHSKDSSVPMSIENHHGYVTMRGDGIYAAATSSMGSEASEFDCMESGNHQHHFVSSHLLRNFVT